MNVLPEFSPMRAMTKSAYENVVVRIILIDTMLKHILYDVNPAPQFLIFKDKKRALKIVTEAINTGIFSSLSPTDGYIILDCFDAIKALEHADYNDVFTRLKMDLKSKASVGAVANLNTGSSFVSKVDSIQQLSDLSSNNFRYGWLLNIMHHEQEIVDKLDSCIKILEQFVSFKIPSLPSVR